MLEDAYSSTLLSILLFPHKWVVVMDRNYHEVQKTLLHLQSLPYGALPLRLILTQKSPLRCVPRRIAPLYAIGLTLAMYGSLNETLATQFCSECTGRPP